MVAPDDVQLRLDRAWEHVESIKREIEDFEAGEPYVWKEQTEAATGNHVFYIEVRAPIPKRIGLLAGECIHQLRSSLDNLIFHIASKHLGHEPRRKTSFPIFVSERADATHEHGYKPDGEKAIADLPLGARQIVENVQPYHSAHPEGDLLWILHRLDNLDKHRRLHVTLWSVDGFILQTQPPEMPRQVTLGSVKDGKEIARVFTRPGAAVAMEANFQVLLGFDEPSIFGASETGRSVVGRLWRLHSFLAKALMPEFEPFF